MYSLSFSCIPLDKEKAISFQSQYKNSQFVTVRTSGSTGQPKEISIPTSKMKASAEMTNRYFELNEVTTALLCLSIDTIAGKMMIVRATEGNYAIEICTPSARPLENIETKIDFIAMVPMQLASSIENDLEKLKSIPKILVGGGPISDELNEKLKTNGLTVYHSFGMTETLSHIAMRKVGKNATDYFEAMPGVTFETKDKQLILSAEHLNVMRLETNDLVELYSPTRFIWKGRADFVVNSGGYKIQLEDLENRISSQIAASFFLWKIPDDRLGEMLILCIENSASEVKNFNFIQNKWERPKLIYVFDQFLRSASDKILRKPTFEQNAVKVHEPTS